MLGSTRKTCEDLSSCFNIIFCCEIHIVTGCSLLLGWVLLSLLAVSMAESERGDPEDETKVDEDEEEEIVSSVGLRGGIRMKKRKFTF